MIRVPPVLEPHIRGNVLCWATLWRITRKDNTIFRFTDHDRKITFESEDFVPQIGSASAKQSIRGLQERNLEVIGYIDDDSITEEDLRRGLFREAMVEEYLIDWRWPFIGKARKAKYWIKQTTFNGEIWQADITGASSFLQEQRGRVYDRTCGWILGDSDCGVVIPTYSVTVVSILEDRVKFTTTAPANPSPNYFNGSLLQWSSGLNNGLTSEVKKLKDSDASLELELETDFDIAPGDNFVLQAACDYQYATCKSRHSNGPKFGGFPFMKGNDSLLATPPNK